MAQGEKSLCENRIIIVFHGLWDMSHNGRTSLNKKTSTQKKERKGEGGVCESVRERQGERRREGGYINHPAPDQADRRPGTASVASSM